MASERYLRYMDIIVMPPVNNHKQYFYFKAVFNVAYIFKHVRILVETVADEMLSHSLIHSYVFWVICLKDFTHIM